MSLKFSDKRDIYKDFDDEVIPDEFICAGSKLKKIKMVSL